MSKRFPIPEFDRDQYKNMEWRPPKLLSADELAKLVARAKSGDARVHGSYPAVADETFFDRFRLQGPHRHVVVCLFPPEKVSLVGRSWAWHIQRALIVDSLDPAKAQIVHEWKTTRPMSTRLGPEKGVTVNGGVLYTLFGHRYSDYWISNRTLHHPRESFGGKGYSVLSASDDRNNDFHACNLAFNWT